MFRLAIFSVVITLGIAYVAANLAVNELQHFLSGLGV